jgi:hypothetical protein
MQQPCPMDAVVHLKRLPRVSFEQRGLSLLETIGEAA